MRLAAITLLCLGSLFADASEWRFVTTTEKNSAVFVDIDSAKVKGGVLKFWSGTVKCKDLGGLIQTNQELVVRSQKKANDGYVPYSFTLNVWRRAFKENEKKNIIDMVVMWEAMVNELVMDFETKVLWEINIEDDTFACLTGVLDGKIQPETVPTWAHVPPESQIEMMHQVINGLVLKK